MKSILPIVIIMLFLNAKKSIGQKIELGIQISTYFSEAKLSNGESGLNGILSNSYGLGISGATNFNSFVDIESGVIFQLHSLEFDESHDKYRLFNTVIPLLARINLSDRLRVIGGPEAIIVLNKKELNRFNISIYGGAEYEISHRGAIRMGVSYSLNDFGSIRVKGYSGRNITGRNLKIIEYKVGAVSRF